MYFDLLGLSPGGDDGDWYQAFEFTSGVSAGTDNRLSDGDPNTKSIRTGGRWRFPKPGHSRTATSSSPGYGIMAPAGDGFEEYDSFVHLDVKDKWVALLSVYAGRPEPRTAAVSGEVQQSAIQSDDIARIWGARD